MRNEEGYIKECLSSILNQNYPLKLIEVIVVDGMSEDNSRKIVKKFQKENPQLNLKLLSNPKKITPCAFNLGIKASKGDVIVILGAHSFIDSHFVSQVVQHLKKMPEVACVGGPIKNLGKSFVEKAIALGMSSPFGVGASFRFSKKAKFVDTLAFGAYRREVFDKIGLFDESLIRNNDYEFNRRLVASGQKIYLTPKIKSFYYVKSSLAKLVKQYFGYGFWKVRVFKKNPKFLAPRQVVPVGFVLCFFLTLFLAPFYPLVKILFLAIIFTYLSLSLIFSFMAVSKNLKYLPLLPIVFAILHFSFGLGFLAGLFSQIVSTKY